MCNDINHEDDEYGEVLEMTVEIKIHTFKKMRYGGMYESIENTIRAHGAGVEDFVIKEKEVVD